MKTKDTGGETAGLGSGEGGGIGLGGGEHGWGVGGHRVLRGRTGHPGV